MVARARQDAALLAAELADEMSFAVLFKQRGRSALSMWRTGRGALASHGAAARAGGEGARPPQHQRGPGGSRSAVRRRGGVESVDMTHGLRDSLLICAVDRT